MGKGRSSTHITSNTLLPKFKTFFEEYTKKEFKLNSSSYGVVLNDDFSNKLIGYLSDKNEHQFIIILKDCLATKGKFSDTLIYLDIEQRI